MKRIFDWLKKNEQQPPVWPEPDQTMDDNDDNEYTIERSCGAEMPGQVGTSGAEREVVMPDIYREKHQTTEPLLNILKSTSPDIAESPGFDPYDTVVLHDKQGVNKS